MRRAMCAAVLTMALMPMMAVHAKAPFVTEATYVNRESQITGQRLFVLPQAEIDVYAAVIDAAGCRVELDLYPTGAWDEARVFEIEIDAAPAEGWTQSVTRAGEGESYNYRFEGPGQAEIPREIRLSLPGLLDVPLAVKVRARPFTKQESAYFLEDEVGRVGVFQALAAAEDTLGAARAYIPPDAQVVDSYVSEEYVSIEYRDDASHVVVDHFSDGHVEKRVRYDVDERIFFASTLEQYTNTTYMDDRLTIGARDELRKARDGKGAYHRSDGITFETQGYRFDDDTLVIDWSASARQPGLMGMLDYPVAHTEVESNAFGCNYDDVFPRESLVELAAKRDAYRGVQKISFPKGRPDGAFDVTMKLVVVEPLVPIQTLDQTPNQVDKPVIIDMEEGMVYRCVSDVEHDEDGGVGFHEALATRYVNEHGWTLDNHLRAYEQHGYFRVLRTLEMTFTVE